MNQHNQNNNLFYSASVNQQTLDNNVFNQLLSNTEILQEGAIWKRLTMKTSQQENSPKKQTQKTSLIVKKLFLALNYDRKGCTTGSGGGPSTAARTGLGADCCG